VKPSLTSARRFDPVLESMTLKSLTAGKIMAIH
jgi:hypothetical protein